MIISLPYPDDLTLLAALIKQEAEGEEFDGKLAVGFVVITRSVKGNKSISDVIYKPWAFSALNTESNTRLNLDEIDPNSNLWYNCYKAAAGALFDLVSNPVPDAVNYLNVELTKKIRGGTLPDWYYKMDIVRIIGKHTFLKDR